MSSISRVDLLVLLKDTPLSLQAELGELLGFGVITQSRTEIVIPVLKKATGALNPEPKTPEIKQPVYRPVIWYVDRYQARHHYQQQTECKHPPTRTSERSNQPVSKPLFSPAQQQVLWDQCLSQQYTTKQPDIPAVIKRMAEVKPITKLPKLKREALNQEILLFLDRSLHLTPLWDDQLEIAVSLKKLLGVENCQALLMLNGLSGAIKKWGQDEEISFNRLPEVARLVFITDRGQFSRQARVQQNWDNELERLKALGHSITVLTPSSQEQNAFFKQQTLDYKPSQFPKLQQAMLGCLQAKLPRIRQLRQQVARGCLADELTLWNHENRLQQPTGLNWRLDPKYLYQWGLIDALTPTEYQQCETLQAQWRGSLPIETEGLEQLIGEVLNPNQKQADISLLDAALDQYEHDSGQHTGVYRWLMSQKELFSAIKSYTSQHTKWDRLNKHVLSAVTQASDEQETVEDVTDEFKPRYIKQLGADLVCDVNSGHHLIASNDVIVDSDKQQTVAVGSRYTEGTVKLTTVQADYQLKTLQQPNWSERFWQDEEGLFAIHCENALFFLQPASADNPKAEWICRYNPWSWASAAGIDDKGLWADLQVEEVSYRLRWIKSGQFMMGSPEEEEGRRDNETQHLVTLTQGYWLGETSCTQALWLAVMDINLSKFEDSLQLPVEMISWNDCQTFISRLLVLYPSFSVQLPTEAQWEYACRAGTKTAYWWGEKVNKKQANYNGKQTKEEKEYPAKDFGLKSMSGNVYEWCADWKGQYPTSEVEDPTGTLTGPFRVLRGGCWISSGRLLRSAFRNANGPGNRSHSMGFRLAGGLDPQASQQAYTASRGPWSGQAGGSNEQVESKKIQGESE